MSIYLVLALVLLVVMAWLILRPFLDPAAATAVSASAVAYGTSAGGAPPIVLPPKDLGSASTATAAPAAVAATAPGVAATTGTTARSTATPASTDELRASVEAAIAARKAAMVRHSCDGCSAPVDAGDSFCRACGTPVKEA
jgi:hypothetical protein